MYSSYTQFPPLITGRHGCKETFCSNYLQLSFSSIRQEPTRPCKLEEMIPHHGIIMSWSFYPIFCLASFCDMNHFYKVPGHPIVAGGTWQQSQTDFQLAGVAETDLTSGHLLCPRDVKWWETFPQVSLYNWQYSTQHSTNTVYQFNKHV